MTRPAPVLEIIRSDGDAETIEAAPPPAPPASDPAPVATAWRRRLRFSVTPAGAAELLLLALLAIQCARLFWILATPLGPVGAWTGAMPAQPAKATQRPLDFDPFFRAGPSDEPIAGTSLDLTLHGVREDRATGRGSAIIGTADGRQQSYVVGEQIMDGVTLTAVAFDSVTIDHNGASEQIFIGSGAAPEQRPAVDAPREAPR